MFVTGETTGCVLCGRTVCCRVVTGPLVVGAGEDGVGDGAGVAVVGDGDDVVGTLDPMPGWTTGAVASGADDADGAVAGELVINDGVGATAPLP